MQVEKYVAQSTFKPISIAVGEKDRLVLTSLLKTELVNIEEDKDLDQLDINQDVISLTPLSKILRFPPNAAVFGRIFIAFF